MSFWPALDTIFSSLISGGIYESFESPCLRNSSFSFRILSRDLEPPLPGLASTGFYTRGGTPYIFGTCNGLFFGDCF